MIDTKEEQIRLYARQLKIPTFANYADTIRQSILHIYPFFRKRALDRSM